MLTLRRNVLLFHQAALGDFVLTWPIAMAAARLWPTNRTIYVTHGSKGELAERAVGIEWRDGDPLHGLYTENGAVSPTVAKLLDGATLIISFVSSGDDAWARNVKRLAPEAAMICVMPRPLEEIDCHLSMFHAEQFQAKPDLQAAIGQMIRHIAASGAVARRVAGDAIVVHPGSGGESKCWPAEKFIELIGSLRKAGQTVNVVIGDAERERWPRQTIVDLEVAAHRVHSPATLVELFETITSARLFIGNDSGPTHLAAISGVPTLALFGRDNDVTWRPLGPGVRLLKHLPLNELPAEEVLIAASSMLAGSGEARVAAEAEDE